MSGDIVGIIIAGVLGGGLLGSAGSFLSSRAMARKLKAETALLGDDAEAKVDSIAVQGAETAVLTLERSLISEAKRADRAEARNADYEKKIAKLQGQLDDLQVALDKARREIQGLLDAAKQPH